MRVHDISRPPSANPMRRDLAAARPQTAAPATRPKPVDAQSSGATASAPAPAAQRPQTACGDVRAEHKARAAQQSLLCDWSFASHAALRHLKHGSWYIDAHMDNAQVTWPLFNSLQGFWPGMQLLVGERCLTLTSSADMPSNSDSASGRPMAFVSARERLTAHVW